MIEQIINRFNALSADGWFYVFCWIVFISFSISYLIVFGLPNFKRKNTTQKYREGLIKK